MSEHAGPRQVEVSVPRSLGELLDFVEELPSEAAGEVVFAHGVVFVENNRICWAAARGLARRLVDLLRARATLDASPQTLEQVFASCKAENKPFGEALLAERLVSSSALREALRIHAAESIVAMMRSDGPGRFHARARGGYSARFTFATGEILAQVAGGLNPDLSERTNGELRKMLGNDDWGAAFIRSRNMAEPLPVASAGDVEVSAKVLLGIGKWASDELDLARALNDGGPLAGRGPLLTSITEERQCAVAWCEDDVVYVVQTTELGLGRVIRRRSVRSIGG